MSARKTLYYSNINYSKAAIETGGSYNRYDSEDCKGLYVKLRSYVRIVSVSDKCTSFLRKTNIISSHFCIE